MNPLLRTVLQRLGLGLVTLLVVSVIIFRLSRCCPAISPGPSWGSRRRPRPWPPSNATIGLNRPPVQRYFDWIGGVAAGRFRRVLLQPRGAWRRLQARPSCRSIAPRLRNTLFLAGMAAIIAVPLSLALGMLGRALPQQLLRPGYQCGDPDLHLGAGVLRRLHPDAVSGRAISDLLFPCQCLARYALPRTRLRAAPCRP